MTIYIVSRNYLRYVFDEFEHLESKMVGYGSLKRAYEGMLEVNAGELGGFIYIGDKITAQKSFALYLQRADMVANKGTIFMIAVNDPSGVEEVLASVKLKHLDVRLYQFDVLTDFCIRREIIAPVVMSRIKPFVSNKPKMISTTLRELKPFQVPEVFSKRFSNTFMRPSSMESLKIALEFDPILENLEVKTFWYEFRKWYLYRCFDKPYPLSLEQADDLDDVEYCSIKYILEGSVCK